MDRTSDKPFEVKLVQEKGTFRLHITHPFFTGRIRKRLGNKEYEDLNNIALHLKFELENHFLKLDINKNDVELFVDKYISMKVKGDASIFDYTEEFLESKLLKINNKTNQSLCKSTISGYRTALKYFEEYLMKRKISPHPSQISNIVLDNYYAYITGAHNYRVKLHTKLKGFIGYLDTVKQLPVDQSYKQSKFSEIYDNQNPGENDIALPEAAISKLIDLRKKFLSGQVKLQNHIVSGRIPAELQQRQFNMKEENLKKCLDCYLLMISTGLYYADIMKSKLDLVQRGDSLTLSYRRAKNNSYCRAIPIQNDEIFIGLDIIKQYHIKSGSNFPLNLSLTHFAKHLGRIRELAGLEMKITNKMARKTFASVFYFKRRVPIHLVQVLLGHKNAKDTAHYLRITDDDIAQQILEYMPTGTNTK